VIAYHAGSSIYIPASAVSIGGDNSRQGDAKAHILNAEAIGPNVPAIKGKAVDTSHQRLRKIISLMVQCVTLW
jgi:hypothetical protein